MKPYFAYIRVSTVRQGERGSSLQEQRDAILTFAARNGLTVVKWFEERETAAKVGRHQFNQMLRAIDRMNIPGVIFHKIDRSARNLKDWSVIQDLADRNVDVRFAQESINLASNEGKLTGDFLAVISSHYIRNLREEVKKGMRGRLKQGIYPLAAPIGYLDQGGGKAKIEDPARAPFIREAFELYANAGVSLRKLSEQLYARGLRSKSGKKVQVNRLAALFRNPFYIGIIRMKGSGETYRGIHKALISVDLYERVQRVLDGKARTKIVTHDFLFRQLVTCVHCGYHLTGEHQKIYAYYRCHTRGCPTRSIRQETIETAVELQIGPLRLDAGEIAELDGLVHSFTGSTETQQREHLRAIDLQIANVHARLSRLTDIYLEGGVDRTLYEQKKLDLVVEEKSLKERRQRIADGLDLSEHRLREYFELLKSLSLSYKVATQPEKRELLKSVASNLLVDRKNVVVELRSPFQEMAKLLVVPTGGLRRGTLRTFVPKMFKLLVKHSKAANDNTPAKKQSLRRAA